MWAYIIGGATIFALVVGFFSVYNSRATRKLILEQERRTQSILNRMQQTLDRAQQTSDRAQQTLERAQQTLDRHGEILEKLSAQHTATIEILKTAQSRSS